VQAHAIGLVVGPHAEEEALGIEFAEQNLFPLGEIEERVARIDKEVVSDRVRDLQRQNAHQGVGCALVGEDPAGVVVDEQEFIGK
jgi:hypothetical protein